MQHHAPPSPDAPASRTWKRRIAKACDSCRRKRSKCSGTRPVCSQCSQSGAQCDYADLERPQRTSRVQRLEHRIRQLETSLRRYERPSDQPGTPPAERLRHTTSIPDTSGRAGRHTVVVGDTGELRYFGPSSNLSILSPDGLKWLESRTADTTLRQRLELPLRGGGSWTKWTHPVLQHMWSAKPTTSLPPWSDAISLVNEFFESYNNILPLFHPPTFMGLLGRQYAQTSNTIEDPAWWASLNAVLAISQRKRAEQNPGSQDLADKAWRYVRNALELLMPVLMKSTSLLSVQAVLALAWFFCGTPNPQPCFFLTGAAVRLSHSIGLHRDSDHLPLSPVDREQRERVFWISCILDSSASFRTGRPAAQNFDDISIPLPSESPKDGLGIIVNRQGSVAFNIFRLKARFSMLEGAAYHRLYDAASSGKSADELAIDVQDLDKEIEDWCRLVPHGQPYEVLTQDWNHHYAHLLCLHLAYQNSVITVNSAIWHRQYSSLRAGKSDVPTRYLPSANLFSMEKCLQSARSIVKLLSLLPSDEVSFMWEVQCPVPALIVLLIHLLQQPHSGDVGSDLQSMEEIICIMSKLMADQEDCFVFPLMTICKELFRVACAAVHRAKNRAHEAQIDHPSRMRRAEDVSVAEPAVLLDRGNLRPVYTAPGSGYQIPIPETSFTGTSDGAQPPNGANLSESSEFTFPELQPGPTAGSSTGTFAYSMTRGEAFNGIDDILQLPLPFPWNWRELSSGLLEDLEMFSDQPP